MKIFFSFTGHALDKAFESALFAKEQQEGTRALYIQKFSLNKPIGARIITPQ